MRFFPLTFTTTSSWCILPFIFGFSLSVKFLVIFVYFLTQLYTVAGQISALSYSLKCLLTELKLIPLLYEEHASATTSGLCFIFQKPSSGVNLLLQALHHHICFLPDLL